LSATLAGPGRPLRVATLDAQASLLERHTRRALLAAGVEIALTLSAADARSFGERAQALRDARPDVVLVALADRGGGDRLALLAEPLRFGCAAQRPAPRVILASSDDGAIARATPLLSPFAFEVVPDVRTEDGRRRIVARLREGSGDEVARDDALEGLARRTAEARRGPALVIDVTGSSTSLVRAEPSGPFHAVHARPLGTGRGADRIVARAGLDRVARWIPWVVDRPTLLERVFNRARWPDAISADRETAALEIALAHEAVGHALADAAVAGLATAFRSARTIVLSGSLAALGPEAAVLVALDALEPIEPASVVIEDGEALVPAASVVPVATSRRALVRITSEAGTREERVDRGAFFVVDVSGDVDVSGSGVTPGRVTAGPLGLVIDARPRPLVLPQRDAERVPTVARWYDALGALAIA